MGSKKPAADKPRWNQDDYHQEFAAAPQSADRAGRRAVAETVSTM